MLTTDSKETLDNFGIIGPHTVQTLANIIKKNHPELKNSTPFIDGWKIEGNNKDGLLILYLYENTNSRDGSIHQMDKSKVNLIKKRIGNLKTLDFPNLIREFGSEFYSHEKFLYIGSEEKGEPLDLSHKIWGRMIHVLSPWMDFILFPKLREIEKEKIKRLINTQDSRIPISEINMSLWVLECEETFKQGTAFSLEGYGIVTCDHVLGTNTKAFKATNNRKKSDIKILCRNSAIDLAIIQIDFNDDIHKLKLGDSSKLEQEDSVAVVGFPNYRIGDTGIVNKGHISGFRMVSGIRRLLVSMPLIAGNSGSPIFDDNYKVIGVAVTGADRMENAHYTEHHGIIPIESLDLLK